MTDETRHPYIIEPKEGVLLTDSLIVYRDRVQQFLLDTGITPEDVVLSPVVSMPLPIISATAGIRIRPQAAPEMMWFPLFWLPLEVGLRYRVRDTEDGSLRVETSEEWAVRVMTMSAVAGLFDPETGTWLDALATVGLDAFDPDTHRRVAEWQQGGSDPDLDRIDLTSRFTATDEEIAEMILSAQQLTQVQWAISAGEIRLATAGILAWSWRTKTLPAPLTRGRSSLSPASPATPNCPQGRACSPSSQHSSLSCKPAPPPPVRRSIASPASQTPCTAPTVTSLTKRGALAAA